MDAMTRWRDLSIGLLLGGVGFVACNDGGLGNIAEEDAPVTVADVICEQAARCGCFDAGAIEDCKSRQRANFEESAASASELGLAYDGNCVGRTLDIIEAFDCATVLGESFERFFGDCSLCKLYHGTKGSGEPCGLTSSGLYYDDCAQGLFCVGQRCLDPCAVALEGDDCTFASCAEGLYCESDYDSDRRQATATCQRAAAQGDDCSDRQCDEQLSCEFETQTCVPRPPPPQVGEPCVGECERNAFCDWSGTADEGICRAQQQDGSACTRNMECLSWSCEGGTCSPSVPIICYVDQEPFEEE